MDISPELCKICRFCLFVCLRSEAVNSSGILSNQMFPKELTEWILRIALIYTFMRVTLMQITLVLPPMRITFVRSAAKKARPIPISDALSFIRHRVTVSNILKKPRTSNNAGPKRCISTFLILPFWNVFSSSFMKRSHTLRLLSLFNFKRVCRTNKMTKRLEMS